MSCYESQLRLRITGVRRVHCSISRVFLVEAEAAGQQVGHKEGARHFVIADHGCRDEIFLDVNGSFGSTAGCSTALEISRLLIEVHAVVPELGALPCPACEGTRRRFGAHLADVVQDVAMHRMRKDRVHERLCEHGAVVRNPVVAVHIGL